MDRRRFASFVALSCAVATLLSIAQRAALRLVLAIGMLAGAWPAEAQAVRRVAILDNASEAVRAKNWGDFRTRLAQLGWTDGKNVSIRPRYADGDLAKLDALAVDIVAQSPDVIVVVTTTVDRKSVV